MSRGRNRRKLGIVLIIVGLLGFVISLRSFAMQSYSTWPAAIGPMMGGYGDTGQVPLTMNQAVKIAEDYLKSLSNEDLAIDEIMEFNLNFYIIYYEKNTDIGAFEVIIDKAGTGGMMRMMGYGYIRPEQGPNMMWNTKYGMHGMRDRGNSSNNAPIRENQAKEYAQRYLDTYLPGSIAEDMHPFYGYYTIHIIRDGKIYGMLSVNSYTGQVWYHNWHGAYIQTREMHEE